MALLGILAGTFAGVWLCDDRLISRTRAEVLQAGVIGLQLPFYGAVTFISQVKAVHATQPVV